MEISKKTQTFKESDKCVALMPKELARMYSVSTGVLRKWIKPIRNEIKRSGRYYTPKQVRLIFDFLGEP